MYKKYITKGGKKVGPYFYTSVRQDGKVKSVYLGRDPRQRKQKRSFSYSPFPTEEDNKLLRERINYLEQKKEQPSSSKKEIIVACVFLFILIFFFLFKTDQIEPVTQLTTRSILNVGKGQSNALTGAFIGENVSEESIVHLEDDVHFTLIKNVDVYATDSATYLISFPDEARLLSFKISGSIQAQETVEITLNDRLVYTYKKNVKGLIDILGKKIKDTLTKVKGTKIHLLDLNGDLHDYSLLPANEDVEIILNKNVKSFTFGGFHGDTIIYDQTLLDSDFLTKNNIKTFFFVDTLNATFDTAYFTTIAKGDYLYQCSVFDINVNICATNWTFVKNITQYEIYTSPITHGSQVFIETINQENTLLQGDFVIPFAPSVTKITHECLETCDFNETNDTFMFTINTAHKNDIVNITHLEFSFIGENYTDESIVITKLEEDLIAPKKYLSFNLSFEKHTREVIRDGMEIEQRYYDPSAKRNVAGVKTCKGEECIIDIYADSVNVKDKDGIYKPFSEVVHMEKTSDNEFTVTWRDNEVVIAIQEETNKPLNPLKTRIIDRSTEYEYTFDYNLTHQNLTPQTLITSNKPLFLDGDTLRIEDVIFSYMGTWAQNFTVNITQMTSTLAVVTFSKNYTKEGAHIGELINVDPTISLVNSNVSTDGDVMRQYYTNGTPSLFTRTTDPSTVVSFGLFGGIGNTISCANKTRRGFMEWDLGNGLAHLQFSPVVVLETNLTITQSNSDDDDSHYNITLVPAGISDYPDNSTGNSKLFNDSRGEQYVGFDLGIPVLPAPDKETLVLGTRANQYLSHTENQTRQFVLGFHNDEDGGIPTCPSQDAKVNQFIAHSHTTVGWRPVLTIRYVSHPQLTVNSPLNGTMFREVGGIILNVTIGNDEAVNLDTFMYVSQNIAPNETDLVYKNLSVVNNTFAVYNITAAPYQPDADTLLLLHLDNNSLFGEDNASVHDFSQNNYDGTVVTDGTFTPGKIAYSYFRENAAGSNRYISFGDKDDLIGLQNISYVFWINASQNSSTAGILYKENVLLFPSTSEGFGIRQTNNDLLVECDDEDTTFSNAINLGAWTHYAVVLKTPATVELYRDGKLFGADTGTCVSITDNAKQFLVGALNAQSGVSGNPWRGGIDDVIIINKSAGIDEIRSVYNLKSGAWWWYTNATVSAPFVNYSQSYNSFFSNVTNFTVDREANATNVSLFDSPKTFTNQPLNCTVFGTDDLSGTLNYKIRYYKNGVSNVSETFSGQANGSYHSKINNAFIHRKNENWSCSGQIDDLSGLDFGPEIFSINTTIMNTAPNIAKIFPTQHNLTTNVTLNFTWGGTDVDNDTLTYNWSIDCYSIAGGECNNSFNIDDRNISGLATATYTNTAPFYYFGDDGFYYNWTVQAYDDENFSGYGEIFNVTFEAFLSVSFVNGLNVVDFGNLELGENNDTTDDSPSPLAIQNDGNSLVDVNLSVNNTFLFEQKQFPSTFFTFKFDQFGRESGSFDTSPSVFTGGSFVFFSNVSNITLNTTLSDFNFTNTNDSVEIDFNVTVPDFESSGLKTANITLIIGRQAITV